MRIFVTRVSLTLKQAQELVNALYPIHLDSNGQKSNKRRDYIANLLIEMLILPVGRAIAYSRNENAYVYDFDNTDLKDTRIALLYEDTQTPQHIISIFLSGVSFGNLKYLLSKQLKYTWPEKQVQTT
jgi:hypothetical protein